MSHSGSSRKRDYSKSSEQKAELSEPEQNVTSKKSNSNNAKDKEKCTEQKVIDAPPPPKLSKGIGFSMKNNQIQKPKGIQIKLATKAKTAEPPKLMKVANAFKDDSDDEVEEMPHECKMRMRNIGRDTPTSSGPNSFGKTKMGFIDSKKMYEKSLRETAFGE